MFYRGITGYHDVLGDIKGDLLFARTLSALGKNRCTMNNRNLSSLNVLLTIDQVSQLTGVKKNTLRYWEKKYGEYLNPIRSKTRHRKYSVKDLEIIITIKNLLENENLSYKGVRIRLAANYSEASNN